jgi:uncharacterized membrane protein HdeD (DUF308 family)
MWGSEMLTRPWWVPLMAGALSLIAGLVVLIEPHGSLLAVTVVVGIYLVIAGIVFLLAGFAQESHRWLILVLGLLTVIAGVLVTAHPDSAVNGVRILLGICLLVSGLFHLVMAVMIEGERRVEIVRGLLELIGAIVLLLVPKLGLTVRRDLPADARHPRDRARVRATPRLTTLFPSARRLTALSSS